MDKHYGLFHISELVGMFLNASGIKGFESFMGLNPDDIADRLTFWDSFKIVYEGKV